MTRKFSSYGPIDQKQHYYAPRSAIIESIHDQLIGETAKSGGHYVTVWAPRQTGKTWIMQQVVRKIQVEGQFETLITTMQSGKSVTTAQGALGILVTNLRNHLFYEPLANYLYLNGVIAIDAAPENLYMKFSSPFVQKSLFYAFAHELFDRLSNLYNPFEDVSAIITETSLNITALIRRYERYFQENRDWLLKDAPRRSTDLRVFEAVYHFNLFMYLVRFLESYRGQVTPEFPTGNGRGPFGRELLIRYAGQIYGLELKSFVNAHATKQAIVQAARYAKKLHLAEIALVFFVEAVDDENRRKFELATVDAESGVLVQSILVTTGG